MNHPDAEDIVAKRRVDHLLSIGPLQMTQTSPLRFHTKTLNAVSIVSEENSQMKHSINPKENLTVISEVEKPVLRVRQTDCNNQPSYSIDFSKFTKHKPQKRKPEDVPTKRSKKVKVHQKIKSSSNQVYDFVITQGSENQDSPCKSLPPRAQLTSDIKTRKVKTGLIHSLDLILNAPSGIGAFTSQVIECKTVYGSSVCRICTDSRTDYLMCIKNKDIQEGNRLRVEHPVRFEFNESHIITAFNMHVNLK